jgi:hypothetical protein
MRTDEYYALVDVLLAKIVRTYPASQGTKAKRVADRLDKCREIRYVAVHIPAKEN